MDRIAMEYKGIDFVALWSGILGALSVVGLLALTFGPWAEPNQVARTILTIGWLTFWMIAVLARNVGALLQTQADQITALQRQLADNRPAA
jgi:hypothetical protein